MHHYSQGLSTKQAHKAIPEGHFEEEQGLLGFFGPASHLIRKRPSTSWTNIEGDLTPHLYDLVELSQNPDKKKLLYNQFITISYEHVDVRSEKELEAERSADGDLILFCHKGQGEVLTEYGLLTYKRGEYVVIPKSIPYVIWPGEASQFLHIENKSSHYEEPARGMVGRHAVYDVNALGKPNLAELQKKMSSEKLSVKSIAVKHNDKITHFSYDECVFDVIGWKGDLFPFTLHTDDMMPLLSHRAHLPPSAHTTFVARDFVVCTFLPRPLESDADALKVPFYHQNIDYDEVLFYHDGDFFSRDNLHAGMMSFHPAGFAHGPHPKALKNIEGKTHTEEYAVMIDTRHPLKVANAAENVEIKDYWKSWRK